MVMTPVYFLSIPGGDSPMEISQDDLRSLLGEIETKLHRSKAYRRALATMQKSLGDSSEPVNHLLKSVGREAISVAFQHFIQAHKKIAESNKQADNHSEKVAVEPGNSTELSQCFTDVNPNKSPNTTTNEVDSLPESNVAVSIADNSMQLRENSPTTKTSMKWLKKFNKKPSKAELARRAAQQRSETLRQIGQQLREAREFQGLSLSQLNTYTHVQIHYMEAVENGNWELLPDEVFVRGYVRVMGNTLGLDGTALAASLPAPESVKSILPSRYESKKIANLGIGMALGLSPVHLYVGYTVLMAGALGGLSMLSQQTHADRLIQQEAVTPSSSFTQPSQDQKPTTKPGLQSSRAGVSVGNDISPPEAI
jgi:transcriptional regulator with XRE-family HTH domain